MSRPIAKSNAHKPRRSIASIASLLTAALALSCTLSGCIVVGASSRGGAFIWPGGLGMLVILLVLFLLLRRR